MSLHAVEKIPLWRQPASMDWCENNYEVTHHIAEFWNTISSLAMAVFGMFGLVMHWKLGRRFSLMFVVYAIVGVGSLLFHATLIFGMQALDELPMLWTSAIVVTLYMTKNPQAKSNKTLRSLPKDALLEAKLLRAVKVVESSLTNKRIVTLMTLWTIITSVLSLQNGKWQFILFHSSYLIDSFAALFVVTRYVNKFTKVKEAKRLWWFGQRFYGGGVLLWLADFFLCDHIQNVLPSNPQLHAWWHVAASIGAYLTCLLTVLCCLESNSTGLSGKPIIQYKWGVPYVALSTESSEGNVVDTEIQQSFKFYRHDSRYSSANDLASLAADKDD